MNLRVSNAQSRCKSQANITRVHIIRGSLGIKTSTRKRLTTGDRWVSGPCWDNSRKEQINRWSRSDPSTMCSSLSKLSRPKTRWHSSRIWCRHRWGLCQVCSCPFLTRPSSSSPTVHTLTRPSLHQLSTWAFSPRIWSAEATVAESNFWIIITYVNFLWKRHAPLREPSP